MKNTPDKAADQGLEFIRRVHQKLQVDPEWCVWGERGFTWWGRNLAQRVWAEPARRDGEGETFCRVHAQTDVFDGFDGSDQQVQLLNLLNHTVTTSAYVPAGDGSGRVRLCCSMLLYPDNERFVWLVFATTVAMQAAEAAINTSWLSDEFRGGLVNAESHHPESGERHLSDEMLEFIDLAVRPEGEGDSRYVGEAMEQLGKELLRPPCLFASGSPEGVTAEYPHPKHSYMMRLMTGESHPRLGSGLLVTLNLPEGSQDVETARAALALNTREAESPDVPVHFVGSWCASVAGLAFNVFFPNVLANPGIPISVAGNTVRRAKWHCDTFHHFDWAKNFESCMQRYMERLVKLGSKPA